MAYCISDLNSERNLDMAWWRSSCTSQRRIRSM